MDNCHQLILPFCEKAGEVELRRIMRTFGIADKPAVDIKIETAGDTEERNDMLLLRRIDMNHLPVNTDEVVFFSGILYPRRNLLVNAKPGEDLSRFLFRWNLRRLVRELITDVDVERTVIAAELPA